MDLRSYLLIVLFTLHSIYITDIDAAGNGSVSDPFQQYVKNGQEAVLQCKYEGSSLKWFKTVTIIANEDAVIDPTKYKVSVTSTGLYYRLHVLNVQPDDELIYSCRGEINEGYYIQLILYVPPTQLYFFGLTNSKLEGMEGTDLLIRCIAVGGKPPPNVSILNGTRPNGIQEVSYTIQTISRDFHQKLIECQATSDALDRPMTTTVQIYLNLKPLTPIFNTNVVSTEETVPLRVSCTSYGSRPAATLTWYIGGNDVTSSSATSPPVRESNDTNTVTSTLVSSVNRTHNEQIIICRASNTVGSASASKNLDVKSVPETPGNFSQISSSTSSIIVQWDPHSGGGYKQTFYIQYRVQGSSEWTIVSAGEEDINEQRRRRTYEVTNLKEGKAYELRMYAENTAMKRSNFTEVLIELTRSSVSTTSSAVIGAVVGVVVTLVIVCASFIVILLIKRNQVKDKKEKNDKFYVNTGFQNIQNGDEYEEVENKFDVEHPQSSKTYETLGTKDKISVYDDLENTKDVTSSKSSIGVNEALGVQEKPSIYSKMENPKEEKQLNTQHEDKNQFKKPNAHNNSMELNTTQERTEKVYENEVF